MRGLLAIAVLVLLTVRAQEAAVPPSKWDVHLFDLEEQAIEAAFKAQIQLLYQNWMKDYAQANAVTRITTGANNARAAYIKAMTRIETRRAEHEHHDRPHGD